MKIETEFADPYAAWSASPDPGTTAALLSSLAPVVDRGLRAYAPDAGPAARGRAKRIVLDALPKYTPSEGRLGPFLMSHLQGLRRVSADSGQGTHVPERVRLQGMALQRAAADIADEFGRDATDSELADRLGFPHHRIAAIRSANLRPFNTGFLENADPEGAGPAVSGRSDLAKKFVYHGLGPEDRLVFEHTTGHNGKPVLSNKEIAGKLGVTPAAISQRKGRIQAAIDDASSSFPT